MNRAYNGVARMRWCVVLLLAWLVMDTPLRAQRSPRFDYFYMEASKCLRNGDAASAVELFTHCWDIDSTAAEVLYSRSLIDMYLLDNDSVGLSLLEEACRRDSCNVMYLNALGQQYLRMRDTEKVIPVLERLSRLQKLRSDVLGQLVSVYRSTGQNDKALNTLQRMELVEGPSQELTTYKADLYKEMGLPDSARAEVQRLCQEFPHEMSYRLMLSAYYADENKADEARQVLEGVQQEEPQHPGLPAAWLYFYQHTDFSRYIQFRDSMLLAPATDDGVRCMLLDAYAREAAHDSVRYESLRVAYDTLTARPDCTVGVLLSQASWLARDGANNPQVAQVMQKVLDKDNSNDTAIRYLLEYYLKQNDESGVEDVCRRGLTSHPTELIYPYFLSAVMYRHDQEAEAISILEQGLRVREDDNTPSLVSDAYAQLGDLYHERDRMEEAYAAYDSSLVYNPDNVPCLNNYAYFLALSGKRMDEAEDMSYRTVVLEPRNVIYLDTYAWILFVKGKFTEARIYMNRALDPAQSDEKLLENEDANGNILEHAGDIHACCGDMEQALRFWKLAQGRADGTCSKRLTSKIKKRKYIK